MLWKNIKLHLYANANKCGKSYQQRPERFLSDVRVHWGKPWERVIWAKSVIGGNQITQNVWIIFQGWMGYIGLRIYCEWSISSSSKYWLRLSRVFLPEIDHLALIILFTSNNLNQGPGYIFVLWGEESQQVSVFVWFTHSSQQFWARHRVLCLFVLIDPDPDTESLIGSLKGRGR